MIQGVLSKMIMNITLINSCYFNLDKIMKRRAPGIKIAMLSTHSIYDSFPRNMFFLIARRLQNPSTVLVCVDEENREMKLKLIQKKKRLIL